MGPQILARVPADLDGLIEHVIVTACERLGFRVERLRGRRKFAIEFGHEAVVDSLPGVSGGSSWVGSFDREEAVEDETIEFFASGHPLVEGILAHIDDTPDGRVASLELRAEPPGDGVVAIYKESAGFEVVALDSSGQPRPEWAAAFRERPLQIQPAKGEVQRRRGRFDTARRPYMVAAVTVRP
jgi:hypothetical protein